MTHGMARQSSPQWIRNFPAWLQQKVGRMDSPVPGIPHGRMITPSPPAQIGGANARIVGKQVGTP